MFGVKLAPCLEAGKDFLLQLDWQGLPRYCISHGQLPSVTWAFHLKFFAIAGNLYNMTLSYTSDLCFFSHDIAQISSCIFMRKVLVLQQMLKVSVVSEGSFTEETARCRPGLSKVSVAQVQLWEINSAANLSSWIPLYSSERNTVSSTNHFSFEESVIKSSFSKGQKYTFC